MDISMNQIGLSESLQHFFGEYLSAFKNFSGIVFGKSFWYFFMIFSSNSLSIPLWILSKICVNMYSITPHELFVQSFQKWFLNFLIYSFDKLIGIIYENFLGNSSSSFFVNFGESMKLIRKFQTLTNLLEISKVFNFFGHFSIFQIEYFWIYMKKCLRDSQRNDWRNSQTNCRVHFQRIASTSWKKFLQ